MKNHFLFLGLFLINCFISKAQSINDYPIKDTLHSIELNVVDEYESTKINNILLEAYKKVNGATIGLDDKGKTRIDLEDGDYIIKIMDVANSEESEKRYNTNYRSLTVKGEDEKVRYALTPDIIKFYTKVNFLKKGDNTLIDSVKLEIEKDESVIISKKGSVVEIEHKNRCFKLEVFHKNFFSKEICHCNELYHVFDSTDIELESRVFSKMVKIIGLDDMALSNVLISFPDFTLEQRTNQNGMVSFNSLPEGYQKMKIGFKKGYHEMEEQYVFVSDINRDKITTIKLLPDTPEMIQIKGTILDNKNTPIVDAEVNLILEDNSIKFMGITDKQGNFSKKVELTLFKPKYQFNLELKHPDFEHYKTTTSEIISLYEFNNKLKEIISSNYKFIRKNDYYTIKLKLKKAEITDKLSVEFRNNNNDSIKQEIAVNQIVGKDGYVEIKVRGLYNFNQVFVKTTINNEERCKTIKVKNSLKLENTIWKMRKCK